LIWTGFKTGKKPKKARKPLRRGRKPIATKAKFKDWGTDKRSRRRTDAEVLAWAREKRQERLSNPTPAEEAFGAILRSLGITYVPEYILQNGDSHICIDFWLPKWNLAIEIDGKELHDKQRRYDKERSIWLAREHKMHVVRFSNLEVLSGQAEKRIAETLGLVSSAGKTVV
jgi:very-short-patch-repair endonuclease